MFDKAALNEIRNTASLFKLEGRALAAVAWVESAGTPFWLIGSEKLPAIRWEGHYFHKRLSGDQLKEAVRQGLANPKAGAVPNPKNWAARYALLERAMLINKEAALESISMGLGQVMGAHWRSLGFTSVVAMWETCKAGIGGQVQLMAKFITSNKLASMLNTHNWAGFAVRYNGQNYKVNAYDRKMADAYAMIPADGTAPALTVAVKAQTNGTMDAKWLQQSLKTLGYYQGKIDGKIGPKTTLAVKLFQKDNGLEDDGIAGSLTKEEIGVELLAKANQKTATNLPTYAAALAGGGSIITTLSTSLSTANEVGAQARGILEQIGWTGPLVSVGVALAVGAVIYFTVKALRESREA